MKETTVDRRIRKTKQQLRQSLTTLLQTKPIQNITVKELADMADINRGTFYLHYRDVFDLLNQIENELLDDLEALLEKYQPGNILPNTVNIFADIYGLVQENSELVGILIGEHGEMNFSSRLNRILRDKCLRDWMEHFHSEKDEAFDYSYVFLSLGCMGIVQHWLKSGMKETPLELAMLTEQIIRNGSRLLQAE